ncbi:hypothetical protein QEH56_15165 [Pelagicoccus enzymogenes]|uniref:hypothetical protein n=1 Tax=Pelagicoccus enzymogenes TaxID=2773457 RepID=UPI00280DEA48|nr:hypothetical protein [Pelagicoccus enzymogenes]MDQ8199504.1 hypothetical protein [Pelagicoccus enzymogenes]
MRERRTFGRTLRWTWALAATVLFHVSLYWGVALTRDSGQKLRTRERQHVEIQYLDSRSTEQSEVLAQRMSLFDPRPLLLPTRWNSANAVSMSEFWQEESEIFPEFTPMFELEDGNYIDDFGNVPANYEQLSMAQVDFGFHPFRELGRNFAERNYQEERGMSMAVLSPSSGRELKRTYIYNDRVQALDAQWPDRRPATLLATVEGSFQVGGLSVVQSSGFDEADREIGSIAYAHFPKLGLLEDGVYLLEMVP